MWWHKPLADMTDQEWERLCDGCGKCCLHKLQDADHEERVYYTHVACELLDLETCRCRHYEQRFRYVSDCLDLRSDAEAVYWMPESCAYRCLVEGRELPLWHYLRSGDEDTVHAQGVSVKGRVLLDDGKMDIGEEHIVNWPLLSGLDE